MQCTPIAVLSLIFIDKNDAETFYYNIMCQAWSHEMQSLPYEMFMTVTKLWCDAQN